MASGEQFARDVGAAVERELTAPLVAALRLRPDILAAVSSRPGLLLRLGAFVALASPGGQWWSMFRARGIPAARARSKGRRARRAFLAAAAALRDREVWTSLSFAAPRLTAGRREELVAVMEELGEAAGALAGIRVVRRHGRRRDVLRQRLAAAVAIAIAEAGLPVSRGRGGLLAAVLVAVLDAAGENPPEDPFRLLSSAVRSVPGALMKRSVPFCYLGSRIPRATRSV